MKNFFKKNLEILLLLFVLLSIGLKFSAVAIGEGLTLLAGACLAFYYLASGILVLADRRRVERLMRLLYFIGLWAVCMSVLGIIGRLHFYLFPSDRELLLISLASLFATLLLAWLLSTNRRDAEEKKLFKHQLQPLALRAGIAFLCVALFLSLDYKTIYSYFGAYRHDTEYVRLLMEKMENPGDAAADSLFKQYHEKIIKTDR